VLISTFAQPFCCRAVLVQSCSRSYVSSTTHSTTMTAQRHKNIARVIAAAPHCAVPCLLQDVLKACGQHCAVVPAGLQRLDASSSSSLKRSSHSSHWAWPCCCFPCCCCGQA
jgi:hypothetical protein